MEVLSFAAIAAGLIGGALFLSWLVRRTDRNTGSTHGGGITGCNVDTFNGM